MFSLHSRLPPGDTLSLKVTAMTHTRQYCAEHRIARFKNSSETIFLAQVITLMSMMRSPPGLKHTYFAGHLYLYTPWLGHTKVGGSSVEE
jgi:hypothetical protein